MPMYDYICPKCEKIKENIFRGMNESINILCECGEKMNVKFNTINILKGHSDTKNIKSTNMDILRHQAKILNETQGGL